MNNIKMEQQLHAKAAAQAAATGFPPPPPGPGGFIVMKGPPPVLSGLKGAPATGAVVAGKKGFSPFGGGPVSGFFPAGGPLVGKPAGGPDGGGGVTPSSAGGMTPSFAQHQDGANLPNAPIAIQPPSSTTSASKKGRGRAMSGGNPNMLPLGGGGAGAGRPHGGSMDHPHQHQPNPFTEAPPPPPGPGVVITAPAGAPPPPGMAQVIMPPGGVVMQPHVNISPQGSAPLLAGAEPPLVVMTGGKNPPRSRFSSSASASGISAPTTFQTDPAKHRGKGGPPLSISSPPAIASTIGVPPPGGGATPGAPSGTTTTAGSNTGGGTTTAGAGGPASNAAGAAPGSSNTTTHQSVTINILPSSLKNADSFPVTNYFPYWFTDNRIQTEFLRDGYTDVLVQNRMMKVPHEERESFVAYIKQKERAAISEIIEHGILRDDELGIPEKPTRRGELPKKETGNTPLPENFLDLGLNLYFLTIAHGKPMPVSTIPANYHRHFGHKFPMEKFNLASAGPLEKKLEDFCGKLFVFSQDFSDALIEPAHGFDPEDISISQLRSLININLSTSTFSKTSGLGPAMMAGPAAAHSSFGGGGGSGGGGHHGAGFPPHHRGAPVMNGTSHGNIGGINSGSSVMVPPPGVVPGRRVFQGELPDEVVCNCARSLHRLLKFLHAKRRRRLRAAARAEQQLQMNTTGSGEDETAVILDNAVSKRRRSGTSGAGGEDHDRTGAEEGPNAEDAEAAKKRRTDADGTSSSGVVVGEDTIKNKTTTTGDQATKSENCSAVNPHQADDDDTLGTAISIAELESEYEKFYKIRPMFHTLPNCKSLLNFVLRFPKMFILCNDVLEPSVRAGVDDLTPDEPADLEHGGTRLRGNAAFSGDHKDKVTNNNLVEGQEEASNIKGLQLLPGGGTAAAGAGVALPDGVALAAKVSSKMSEGTVGGLRQKEQPRYNLPLESEGKLDVPKSIRRFEVGAAEKFVGMAVNLLCEDRQQMGAREADEKFAEFDYVEELVNSLGGMVRVTPQFRTIREPARTAMASVHRAAYAGVLPIGGGTGGGGSSGPAAQGLLGGGPRTAGVPGGSGGPAGGSSHYHQLNPSSGGGGMMGKGAAGGGASTSISSGGTKYAREVGPQLPGGMRTVKVVTPTARARPQAGVAGGGATGGMGNTPGATGGMPPTGVMVPPGVIGMPPRPGMPWQWSQPSWPPAPRRW
ncbi:unnamed protein product [Amoebophrya sp. A25]|nr:unnamed protein product [Amoebophrya sp. A25]|eukprot:GSA25T00010723001.1